VQSRGSIVVIRLTMPNKAGALGLITQALATVDAGLGAIDTVRVSEEHLIRDLTIDTRGADHAQKVVEALDALPGLTVHHVSDRTFLIHLGGKIEMQSKFPLNTRDELSMAYTPGVARVCQAIADEPKKVFNLTSKRNTVAVVTDGSAVLGLGNIGPEAAMPVMEGKAQLFKRFADVDSWPICLDTQDTEAIIQTVKAIAPTFGGINLEDIAAPRCFEIERRLVEELDIPVFHDDQHGTAVVMTAALINALRLVRKEPEDVTAVVAGVGAAGTACMLMMRDLGITKIIGCDRQGALYEGREGMNSAKQEFAAVTNPDKVAGDLKTVLKGADIFIGLSGPGLLDRSDIVDMAHDPIVFAMSNPEPEIAPAEAAGVAAVMATGRSDYANQINNVLCFPGLFRGALDCRAKRISEGMKMAAAKAIASCIGEADLCPDYVIPSVFDSRVASAVAEAVVRIAREEGLARA
jgi:malate dehydrogenase (oxaloacetate-decarboxylating)